MLRLVASTTHSNNLNFNTLPKTINITLRQKPEKHEQVKALAGSLNTTPAQVYKWLVDASLEIVEDNNQQVTLPATLSMMRGLRSALPKLKSYEKRNQIEDDPGPII